MPFLKKYWYNLRRLLLMAAILILIGILFDKHELAYYFTERHLLIAIAGMLSLSFIFTLLDIVVDKMLKKI